MARREHPAPLPGIAKIRLVADDEATAKILAVLSEHFTCTAPAGYSGGRSYLEIDTRPAPEPESDAVTIERVDAPKERPYRVVRQLGSASLPTQTY
ncbi:hypothetical protein [Streptomyces tsukubensis]|uniref:hypothetical protein n=1 Tax=Streptomyces tsukubensis TaxID=83656 RepID=UPI00344D29E7